MKTTPYLKRASGVLLHVSSLPGDYSGGAFGKEARAFIDLLAAGGFSWWQVLPFCLPDEVNSPYKSHSAFSLNPFFIDLPDLYDRGLLTKAELDEARQQTPYACEFDRLQKERLPLLSKAAARFTDTAALADFLREHPHTADFCRFIALKAANGLREWQTWTVDAPDPAALRTWEFTQYIAYVQWTAVRDYAHEKGIKLIGDIPIYVALDSADVWAAPGLFRLEPDGYPSSVAGVPPDYFAADGQLWGNPLYDWDEMEKDGFRWWRERMEFMTDLFDGVRIDHFRGLESYYSIPATEKTARNGKWIKGPGMALISALCEVCGDKLLIAEDLGDITDEVRSLVEESGWPGMRVLQFAFLGDPGSPHLPHNDDNNCIAYTGTHDNNTLLGYIWELDEAARKNVLRYFGYAGDNWDACYDTILQGMFRSHAGLAVFPIQDLLHYGADTRFNKPGEAHGNWSYRVTADQLGQLDLKNLAAWNRLYGRC